MCIAGAFQIPRIRHPPGRGAEPHPGRSEQRQIPSGVGTSQRDVTTRRTMDPDSRPFFDSESINIRVATILRSKPGAAIRRTIPTGLAKWNAFCDAGYFHRAHKLPRFSSDGVPMDHTKPLRGFSCTSAVDHPFVSFVFYLTDVCGIENGGTLANYVSIVNTTLTKWYTKPPPKSTLVWALINRFKQVPRIQLYRDPAPPELIVSILRDTSIDRSIIVALTLMWFMSTRISDTTSSTRHSFDPNYTLLRSDVVIVDDDLIKVVVPHSKSDRYNTGSTHFIASTGGPLCPVAIISKYIEDTAHRPANTPFLRRDNGENVTRSCVSKVMKKHAIKLGLDPRYISPHSTRSGSATRMVEQGLSIADVLLQGQWASEQSCLRYLRMTRRRATAISKALSLNHTAIRKRQRLSSPLGNSLLSLRQRRPRL